ncbi:MAG: flagellar motor switch protein FliM [Pedosphaera sp.]|nr:flagellar motor switch protein FliM [Pedosphaera sp.]
MSNPPPSSDETVSPSDIEQLLAQAQGDDAAALETAAPARKSEPESKPLPRHEFPKLSFFSGNELRKLHLRHEEFIDSLAGRLSMHLGLEVGLQLTKLETIPFQKFADSLSNPTHLTLLKLEPLNGTCLLDIPPHLGLCMVDRELGGPAVPLDETREIGKMETRLLDKIVETIVGEWCGAWRDLLELRPAILKHENNARFLQICAPDTMMLVLSMETRLGELTEQIQFAVPRHAMEPLLLKLNAANEIGGKPVAASVPAAGTSAHPWNPAFDEVELSITAELPDIEVTARQLSQLKPGDVIPLLPELAGQIRLCFAGAPKFTGTLGTADGHWAVKIEQAFKA